MPRLTQANPAYRKHRASGQAIVRIHGKTIYLGRWKSKASRAEYDRVITEFRLALHQTCLAHLLRRCKELLERATRGAVIFPRKVKALLQESLEIRDQRDAGKISVQAVSAKADDLQRRMKSLTRPPRSNALNERLAAHLHHHLGELFTFLRHPGIDATNHKAEQAIRPAVVNRKVWGGNRTEAGAAAQSILMSVLFTAIRQGRDALEFLGELLRALPTHRPILLARTG